MTEHEAAQITQAGRSYPPFWITGRRVVLVIRSADHRRSTMLSRTIDAIERRLSIIGQNTRKGEYGEDHVKLGEL